MKKTAISILVLIVLGVGLIIYGPKLFTHKEQRQKITNPDELPGIQKSEAPWDPEINNLRQRLSAIGLPALSAEGTVLHIHQHIDIFVNGKQIAIPADIGINSPAEFISPLHTHDPSGIIHVESPTVETFTLGQFFDIWGVKFTSECLGDYCSVEDRKLQVFINGQEKTGDFRSIALESHQEIVVTFGSSSELPNPIPTSYTFQAGM